MMYNFRQKTISQGPQRLKACSPSPNQIPESLKIYKLEYAQYSCMLSGLISSYCSTIPCILSSVDDSGWRVMVEGQIFTILSPRLSQIGHGG